MAKERSEHLPCQHGRLSSLYCPHCMGVAVVTPGAEPMTDDEIEAWPYRLAASDED